MSTTPRQDHLVRWERIRALHAEGLSDGVIADRLGCHHSTLWLARKRLGLPSNSEARNPKHGTPGTRRGEVPDA